MLQKTWIEYLLLAVIGFAFAAFVFGPALSFPYQFDDLSNVITNRAIRYLSHPRIFFEAAYLNTRPVTNISYAINYYWSGLSLAGLRWPNVAFHVLSALLVFRLGRLGLSRPLALLAALLFLVHPIAVDSVIYLSGRSAILALFFSLAALCFLTMERQGFTSWLGFLACSVLAALSRESAAVILLLALLVQRQTRRSHFELVPYLAPFLVPALLITMKKWSFLDSMARGFFRVQGDIEISGLGQTLLLNASLWSRMALLYFQPHALAIDHQIKMPASWWAGDVIFGGALMLALAGCFFLALRRRNFLWLALAWILVVLLPTSTVVPVLDPFGERYLYYTLPGFVWALAALMQMIPGFGQDRKWLYAGALGIPLLVAVAASAPRREVWRTSSSLWGDAYRKYPEKFRVAFNYAHFIAQDTGDHKASAKVLAGLLQSRVPGALNFEEQELVTESLAGKVRILAPTNAAVRALLDELGFAPGFWRDYLALKVGVSSLAEADWMASWNRLYSAYHEEKTPSKDPFYYENVLKILASDFYYRKKDFKRALHYLEPAVLAFPDRHSPYWIMRERLGHLYEQFAKTNEAVHQYELATFQYKVFRRFPEDMLWKISAYYKDRADYLRASDALGELINLHPDNSKLRRNYAEMLSRMKSKHAAKHSREADYYEKHAVTLLDEREYVRP